jgi:hypothetical protein
MRGKEAKHGKYASEEDIAVLGMLKWDRSIYKETV